MCGKPSTPKNNQNKELRGTLQLSACTTNTNIVTPTRRHSGIDGRVLSMVVTKAANEAQGNTRFVGIPRKGVIQHAKKTNHHNHFPDFIGRPTHYYKGTPLLRRPHFILTPPWTGYIGTGIMFVEGGSMVDTILGYLCKSAVLRI